MRHFERWVVSLVGVSLVAAACFGDVNQQSDTDAPIIQITSPSTDTVAGLVIFQANVQDAFGVDKVVFKVDGTTTFQDLTAPYQTTWNTISAGNGPHSLRVEATDINGNASATTLNVVVDNRKN